MNSRLASGLTSLLDDLELIPLPRPLSGGAQQTPQRPRRAALASDHFAHVAFGDFKLNHAVVELLHEHLVGSIDQRPRNHFDERANISRRLIHMILTVDENSRPASNAAS